MQFLLSKISASVFSFKSFMFINPAKFIIKSNLPFFLKTSRKTASRVDFSRTSTPFSLENPCKIAPSAFGIFAIYPEVFFFSYLK